MNRIKLLSTVIASILGLTLLVSCTVFSPIVGTWKDSSYPFTIQFTREGNIVINSSNYITTGTWSTVSSNVISLHIEGLSGDLLTSFGGSSWQYSISGGTLTVITMGGTETFHREEVDTPSTTKVSIQSITVQSPKENSSLTVGQTVNIKWKSSNVPKSTQLFIYLTVPVDSSGEFDMPITLGIPNTGSYTWSVPSTYQGHPIEGVCTLVLGGETTSAHSRTALTITK